VYGGAYGGTVLGGIIGQSKGSGLTPLSDGSSRYGYDLGTLPAGTAGGGRGGIFAPSGYAASAIASPWRDVPAGSPMPSGSPTTIVNFAPGSITQSGTVISQDRDWDSLTQQLAHSLSGVWASR
jgi:hypothetical protein